MPATTVRRAQDGERLDIGPTRNWVLLAAQESDGFLGAIEMELGAGFAGPPEHRHLGLDLWYVLDGEVAVTIGAERTTLGVGDVAFIPRAITHAFANLSIGTARILEVDTPKTGTTPRLRTRPSVLPFNGR